MDCTLFTLIVDVDHVVRFSYVRLEVEILADDVDYFYFDSIWLL